MKGGSTHEEYGIATVEAKRSRPIDAGRPLGQHTLNGILPRVCHPVSLHSLGSLAGCHTWVLGSLFCGRIALEYRTGIFNFHLGLIYQKRMQGMGTWTGASK
jgi:hypothetical protein